jgi:hypothetical protein
MPFNEKTQGYIDKTLLTLNTWFGGGGNVTPTPTPTSTPKNRPQQDDNNKPKTGLYIGIGAGVLAIVGVSFYLIKRKK